jgi:hypothetical protein
MKNGKILFLGILVMVLVFAFVPSVFAQTDGGEYFIAGISTREDIGGVEVSSQYSNSYYRLIFENYNNFPVSVIFEFSDNVQNRQTGTIVLRAGEKKEASGIINGRPQRDFKLIVRKLSA